MALRPNTLEVKSSTQVEIGFSKTVSSSIGVENFFVSTSVGIEDSIKILDVFVSGSSVILTTNPQVAGTLYLLVLKDSDSTKFSAEDGDRLINDDVSRTIYFVGSDAYNPIRDRMLLNVPKTYNLDGSNIKNILSIEAEELYQVEKHIGEVLSDNYISVRVEDEFRVRGPGAKDRLSHENAYLIESISRFQSGANLIFKELNFNKNSSIKSQNSIPNYPISLQQEFYSEEITFSNINPKLSGYLLNLEKNNIIKLESLSIIRPDENLCSNNEYIYNIENLKYSIKDNKYDPNRAYSYPTLNSNQILLSESSGFILPSSGDLIKVSYLYKDSSQKINQDSIVVFNIQNIQNEIIPQESTRFFLKNAPITNERGEPGSLGDLQVESYVNNVFINEIPFNTSKLPSSYGEYSVNYETGEVIVFGNRDTFGTGDGNYSVNYFYRKNYIDNLDYYVDGSDIVATSGRSLVSSAANILLNYQQQFLEGVDYIPEVHIEVLNEEVQSNLLSTFTLKTKKAPVTRVFSITNQTTGEVYQPVSFYKNEINFSGINPPKFISSKGLTPTFEKVQNEKISPYFKFLNSIFKFKITDNSSINNITISPPIPSNLIDLSSTEYLLKDSDGNLQNMKIKFFSSPDLNENINSFALTSSSDIPVVNKEYTIGIECLSIQLQNKGILNKQNNAIGSFVDSSLMLDNLIFKSEKCFFTDFEFSNSTRNSLTKNDDNKTLTNTTLSKLKSVGDYLVDYKNSTIHLATGTEYDKDLGYASYDYSKISSNGSNIITCDGIFRKTSGSSNDYLYMVDDFSLNNGISLNNLNSSFEFPTDFKVFDENQNEVDTNIITDNYLLFTRLKPVNFYGLFNLSDVFGNNSSNPLFRSEPLSGDEISVSILDGGHNLYLKSFKITDNYLDLKTSKLFKAKNNYGYSLYIPKENFDFIYSIKNLTLNIEISDQTLDGLKYFTENYNVEDFTSISTVYLDAGLNINLSDDYLKDNVGFKFKILSYDEITGEATVENIPTTGGFVIPSIGSSKIVNEILLTENDSYVIINISDECLINNGDQIEVIYLYDFIPSPGTRLCSWYDSAPLYYDSTYSNDNLIVSYEYGDNEINWQINNSISERERYYVTYRYGALRDSLKNNFGLLTKIPFFTKFLQNTDREIYRKALQGTLEAFSRGPVISSFENLIQKFTEQKPEISESFFGSWILGRDLLNPRDMKYDGILKFESGKFDSGVLIDNGVVVSAPAKTSLNVDEGTFSCWIRSDWNGINNDADLTFDLSKMSKIFFDLKINSDIFKNQDFNLFMSEDRYGFADWSGEYISLYNYITIDNSESIGPFGITKYHDRLNSSKYSKHSISLSANILSKSNVIGDFYRIDSGILSERLISFGMGGLFSGGPDSSRGYSADGLEIFLSYYTSPFVVSIGDNNKTLIIAGSLTPIINNDNNRLYVLKIEDEDIDQSVVPNFDGPYLVKNCNCISYDDLNSLESFGSEFFNKVKITLTEGIDISYLSTQFNIIDGKISGFKYVLEDGRVYSIISFVDGSGNETLSIPNDGFIYGFYVNRIPDNQQHLIQSGSSAINNSKPSGTGIILVPAISVIRERFDSEFLYNFDPRPILANFTTDIINLEIYRQPLENSVSISINNYNSIVAYSDLISSGEYSELFEFLNLNSFFSSEYGLSPEISGSSDLNDKLFIGCLDPVVKNKIDIHRISYSIEESLSLNSIYIGSGKVNPKNYTFNLNKDLNYVYGTPDFNSEEKSLYVWLDENCKVDGNSVGSWKLKTIIPNQSIISIGPDGYSELDGYSTDYLAIELDDYIEGSIRTNGGFSYTKSTIDESCPLVPCDGSFRFCGQSTLEDSGWKSISNFGSDLINTIIGGSEHNVNKWRKNGIFDTSIISNFYRIENISDLDSYLYLPLNCIQDMQYEISFKVLDFDSNIIGSDSGSFSGNIAANLIGLTIAEIFDGEKDIKVSLAANESNKYLVIMDGISNNILDLVPFDWDNGLFNSIEISLNKYDNLITFYHKNLIISRINYSNFETYVFDSNNILEVGIFVRFNDKNIVSNDFIDVYNQVSLDIDYIELNLTSTINDSNLEENDKLIIQQDLIDFKFYNKADGYADAYGYLESGSDIDTIVFVSDLERYIFDSGSEEAKNRISLYKDFYGYLNFRIYDSLYKKDRNFYNISSNIKSFSSGDFHHIAASWRLNTEYNKDEIHLFIDGKEVPSLYTFGGYVSPWFDSKVGEVARDVIQDFSETKANYYESYNDGQILAGESYMLSLSSSFTNNDIGKTIIIKDAGIATELNDRAFIIGSVVDKQIYLLDIDNLTPYYFGTSSTNIQFYRPPHVNAGSLQTIFGATKFEIYKIDYEKNKAELGGIIYNVEDNLINIIQNNVVNPKYRINLNNGSIDFLYKDIDCKWKKSIDISDLDIWVESFGLNKSRVYEKINYSSTRNLGPEYMNGIAGFVTNMPEPIDLKLVKITRILLDNFIPDGNVNLGTFSFEMNVDLLVSSEYQEENYGRLVSIKFDSDNINYCEDGYGTENYIYIEGETPEGFISEYVYVNENKIFNLNNFYTKITKISGNFNIIDENYEPLMLSLFETNSITEENNYGNYAEIYRYSNGVFYITAYGSSGQEDYILPSGIYVFDYPSYLSIRLPYVGEDIFLGSNIYGDKHLGGLIEEVKITTEMCTDTRDYQSSSLSQKSITEEYISNNKPCLDSQTIFLSHFDDPFDYQIRRLRNKIFLNFKENFKYKLNNKDLELLSNYINDKTRFISEMKKMGHSNEVAEETYVEAHMADGGPLFNEAKYNTNNLTTSFSSVNSSFNNSGKFYNSIPVSYNGQNIFDNTGTIEFWFSPLFSTDTDLSERIIFDSFNVKTAFVTPISTGIINLPTSASKILSITLPEVKDSDIYVTNKYDDISRSKISGILEGGTGILNNFSSNCVLKNDGKTIYLKTKLISNDPVVIKYFEKDSNESRIKIYFKDRKIFFQISNKYSTHTVYQDIDFKSNSWNKIAASWKVNTEKDYIKLSVNGATTSSSVLNERISLLDKLEQLYIGSGYDGSNSALSRIDNFRISKIDRLKTLDSIGNYLDINYSSNLNSVKPLTEDKYTSYINNFEFVDNNNYATITDLVRGIYDFDIEVIDDFGKINSSEVEDLIVYLVNKLKPSHTNVLVKFKRKTC